MKTIAALAAVLDSIPEFRALEAAETALQKHVAVLRAPGGRAPVDLAGEAVAALIAGKPIPEDLGRRAWEEKQRIEFTRAELEIVVGLDDRLRGLKEGALRKGANGAFPILRTMLDDLVTEARPMASLLLGINDAQAAIDAGPDTVKAWSGFNDLASRYRELRSAQYVLTRASAGDTIDIGVGVAGGGVSLSGIFPVWSEIANVTELWPEYTPKRWDDATSVPPWPTDAPGKPFQIKHDRAWFLWVLTTPGVRLWLPTAEELAAGVREQRTEAAQRDGQAMTSKNQRSASAAAAGEIPQPRRREPRREKPDRLVSDDGDVREPGAAAARVNALADIGATQDGEDY
ncbi:hypothetical protein [Streptomyces niveus]|uniref:hypothetical protein n=1 Tax=Streptomyces niveus TaxID=193462 RepID=UPI003685D313